MKAIDSVSHHISLWKRPHAEQKGTVLTDKESDMPEKKRGTNQGDPLSSFFLQHSTPTGTGR